MTTGAAGAASGPSRAARRWRRAGARWVAEDPGRATALLGLAWCVGVTVVGFAAWRHPTMAALLVVGPLITASVADPRTTAGVGVASVAMAIALAWPNRTNGDLRPALVMSAVALSAVAATVIASRRQTSDDRLLESRHRERGERRRRMALEARARTATLARDLAAAADPAQVAEVVFAAVRREWGADAAILSLLTERGTLRASAQFGYREGVLERWREVPIAPEQPSAHVLDSGAPLWAESVEEFARQWPSVAPAMARNPHRSLAVLPLTGAGGPIGVLALSFVTPQRFTASERSSLRGAANAAAAALERSRAAAIDAEDVATAVRLERVSAAVATALTPEEVARAAVQRGMEAVGAVSGMLRRLSADEDRLECLWAEGADLDVLTGPVPVFGTPSGAVLSSGEPLWFDNRDDVTRAFPVFRSVAPALAPGRLAYLPLRTHHEVLGVLGFSFEDPQPFTVSEERLLEALAEQCAAAFERALLYSRERAAREDAERSRERLMLLSDVTRLLISSLDLDQVIARLVTLVTRRFANACVVMVPGEQGLHRVVVGGRAEGDEVEAWRVSDPDVPFGSDAPAAVAYRTGVPQMVDITEATRDRARRNGAPEVPGDSVTALAVPMPARDQTVGVMTFIAGRERVTFGPDEISLAVEVAARAGLALDNANRYAREHDVAETLQRAVLPRHLHAVEGLELSAEYRPGVKGTAAGGDWYDTATLVEGRLYFSVGDVMGKGTAAAALMGQVRSALRAYAALEPSPAAVLDHMDALFDALHEDRLVTAVVGTVEPATGAVRLASAGHPAPVVVDAAGGIRLVEGPGSLVLGTGALRKGGHLPARREHRFQLERGDTLVLFSDGLLERRGEHISTGFERIAEAVTAMRELPPLGEQGPAARLVDLVSEDGGTDDDVVVLTIHRSPPSPRVGPAGTNSGAEVSAMPIAGMSKPENGASSPAAPAGSGAGPGPRTTGVPSDEESEGERETVMARSVEAVPRDGQAGQAPGIALPAVVTSTPAARHWITEQLADLPRDIADTAGLLVSELVTNAVLHAATSLAVSVHRFDDRIRVDVADGSPAFPSPRDYGVDATTGRGLTLLEVLPTAWGVEAFPWGKVVWFELPVDTTLDVPAALSSSGARRLLVDGRWLGQVHGPRHRTAPVERAVPEGTVPATPTAGGTDERSDPDDRPPGSVRSDRPVHTGRWGPEADTFVLQLLDTPTELLQRSTKHYEALFRELRLIAERDPGESSAVPPRLLELIALLGTRFAGFGRPPDDRWRVLMETGRTEVDLRIAMTRSAAARWAACNRLFDEADEYCRTGDLITMPPDPLCADVRRWVLHEMGRQAEGRTPRQWDPRPAIAGRPRSD